MDDPNRQGYPGEEHFYDRDKIRDPMLTPHRSSNLLKVLVAMVAILVVIVIIMAVAMIHLVSSPPLANTPNPTVPGGGPSTGSTPTQAASTSAPATPTPTSISATPTPVAVFPCIVNVGTWIGGSPDWKTLNGVLLNDGTNGNTNGPSIVAPCQLGNATDYAVEAKIQVIRKPGYDCFGITVRGSSTSSGWQGYIARVGTCGFDNWGTAYIAGPNIQQVNGPFDPGTLSHTYRVEVKGNVITFLIDGSKLLTLTDNHYLIGSQVGLLDGGVQLQVTSFQVTAL